MNVKGNRKQGCVISYFMTLELVLGLVNPVEI